MKNLKLRSDKLWLWLLPIALGCVLISLVWLSSDIESKAYLWNVDNSNLLVRFEALLVAVVNSYICIFLHQYFVKKYTAKNQQALGSLYAVLLSLVAFNLGVLFVSYVVNKQGFSAELIIRCNIVGIPILTIIYLYQRYRYVKDSNAKQALQLEKIKSEQFATELDYLKAQYHPHFLFNALNTIYFQIDDNNQRAKHTIELLSDLLRYQLYDIKNLVTLEQEIAHLRNNVEFQKMRASEKLAFDLYVDTPQPEAQLYPLLFQPLVENAFKYVCGSELHISCSITQTADNIVFAVQNTIASATTKNENASGVGIANLRRRLELLYPQRHKLTFVQTDSLFKATLTISTN